MVPDQASIDEASKTYWGLKANREDTFLRNYNNLIFLQMEKKHHKKHHKTHKAVPGYVLSASKTIPYAATGAEIIFGMMDENTNGFAGLSAFMRMYRFSALFLELDSMVQQRVTYQSLSNVRKPLTL
jgi:hypothetical protein